MSIRWGRRTRICNWWWLLNSGCSDTRMFGSVCGWHSRISFASSAQPQAPIKFRHGKCVNKFITHIQLDEQPAPTHTWDNYLWICYQVSACQMVIKISRMYLEWQHNNLIQFSSHAQLTFLGKQKSNVGEFSKTENDLRIESRGNGLVVVFIALCACGRWPRITVWAWQDKWGCKSFLELTHSSLTRTQNPSRAVADAFNLLFELFMTNGRRGVI